MNLSRPFIARPIATTLLAVAIAVAGAVAYRELPVAPLPQVDLPTVNVQALLPGASPETMASAVATPLERRFGRIAGLTDMTSTSTLGATNLTLQFDLSRSIDGAARDVQAGINAASGDLPANLPSRPTWRKVNPSDAPILILALTSETLPLGRLYDAANAILAQKIAQLPGVGQVFVGGGQTPAVRVQVDPAALAGAGLTLENVRNVLAAATLNQAKGALDGPVELRTLAANDQLLRAAQYPSLVLAVHNGETLRLGDVAHVIEDVENNRVAAWVDGRRCVLIIIRRQPGANIIAVIERIKSELPRFESSISSAIHIVVASDRSQTIRASIADVQLTLVVSLVLVVAVVFLFLRSGRATIVPSMALPLSVLGTFVAMYLLGFSLDNLSLMALTISTGFVVDDAIVVTENVMRYIERGDTPRKAALAGARQIGFTIVSITLSLLAVFIPLLLMGGVVGRLLREFALTLSVAIAISAILSLTLTPMMCAHVLRPQRAQGRLARTGERLFLAITSRYERGLDWVLGHDRLVVAITMVTLVVTIALYVVIPKGLFPQQDTGSLVGFSDAPQDISFPAMRQRQEQLNAIVKADPAVHHAVSFIGGGAGSAGNTGTMFIELVPLSQRKQGADAIIRRLREQLTQVIGITLYLQSVQDVRVGGRVTRTQYQYTLQDADLAELNRWAPRLLDAMRRLPELRDVASDQQNAALQLDVTVDRDSAARVGILPATVDNTLYDAFGQRQVATLFTQLNEYHVILEVKPALQSHPEALRGIYAGSGNGVTVPLAAFSRLSQSTTSLSVNHQGQFPSVTISFNVATGSSLGEAVQAITRAEQRLGMPASLRASFTGTAQLFAASLATEPYLILAALVAVYIVLGVLYESYVHPITILSTLPSAGMGALLGLLLLRTEFSIIALIGIVLLIGIVKKNAIMMIDFALEAERSERLSSRESIRRASLARFRPIMMTTMAALLGGLPLAFSYGTGSELRRPLGITIVGGLLVSQLLTLFSTPVIYLALDRLTRRWREQRRPRS
ncbi:MAG: Acriflavin resistance protein [bacterium]|nr:Acriflavin resistance protein [bacterium]